MDEKERFDTNREAQHDAAAQRDRPSQRQADAIARFVGAALYDDVRRAERKRERRDGKAPSQEDNGTSSVA